MYRYIYALQHKWLPTASGVCSRCVCVCATNPATKHLNGSMRDILVFPCTRVDTMADSSQLTQGGSNVRRPCQSTIVGAVCTELRISEQPDFRGDFKIWIKKQHWVDSFIIVWMCLSHIYVQATWKVNFTSDDPFKRHKLTICWDSKNQIIITCDMIKKCSPDNKTIFFVSKARLFLEDHNFEFFHAYW